MTAYKLLRLRSDGSLGSLFVGRQEVIIPGVTYKARSDLPHPGLAHRPGFHCTSGMSAPHLKMRLRSGEVRVWCRVEIARSSIRHERPQSQGGLWWTSPWMRVTEIMKDDVVIPD